MSDMRKFIQNLLSERGCCFHQILKEPPFVPDIFNSSRRNELGVAFRKDLFHDLMQRFWHFGVYSGDDSRG
jgi:hypothetical protein